jgi:hypothetical protein
MLLEAEVEVEVEAEAEGKKVDGSHNYREFL